MLTVIRVLLYALPISEVSVTFSETGCILSSQHFLSHLLQWRQVLLVFFSASFLPRYKIGEYCVHSANTTNYCETQITMKALAHSANKPVWAKQTYIVHFNSLIN